MKNILVCLILFITIPVYAQTFSNPESVEYDAANNRWLVGQNNSGKVLIYNPTNGVLTDFCVGMTTGPYGIEILGNVLYCCDGSRVKGYDLTSGTMVFNLNLNATFLNGITSDGNNFLFVTDYSAKKIFRINVSANSFNPMATIVKSPNGIIYDSANNRCVFVTWGANAPIQAISLMDSTISTLITTTLTNLDGIIRDSQGNWYVSAWGTNSLNKTDAAFSYNPVSVKNGLSSPADLGINATLDSIGIPNSGSANNVVFHAISNTSGINDLNNKETLPFPNPSGSRITITLDDMIIDGRIELTDISGKEISSDTAKGNIFYIDKGELSTGNYIIRISDRGKVVYTKQIVFK